MNLASASLWLDGSEIGRGRRLAWAARDRLSLRDRSLLEAQRANRLRTWQAFVQKFPDVPEAWSILGDAYYHNGPLLGITDAPQLALAAFRRAIALDPDTTAVPFAEPMMHLADLALATGDTAGATRLLSRLLASDSTGDGAASQQLTLAHLSGDTAKVAQLRREFPRMSWPNLFHIVFESQQNETKIPNAQPALEAVRTMGEAPAGIVRILAHDLALNRGRPREARSGGEPGDFHPRGNLRIRISDAVYWEGDTSLAATAAESLARLVAVPPPPATDRELHAYYYDVCMLEQWRLAHDDLRSARASISRLRAAALVPGIAFPEEHERCADLLDAWFAVAARRPDALQRLLRVDSLQVQEPSIGITASAITASNLIMARLWRMQGDWPRAEAAARRRYTGLFPAFLSTHLLEEGRAAAQAGHREVAIRALRHYLALRYDPEPSVEPEVEAVRTELAQLLKEPGPLGQRP
jgi:tetratricopeptide (TPR) repeat protein